jgi:AraC-like DNA-binding protein
MVAALLLAAYSIVAAVVIALTQFRCAGEDRIARLAGLVLLTALAGLQAVHLAVLLNGVAWPEGAAYRFFLFAVAPAFYLYARSLLTPRSPGRHRAAIALHALPAFAATFIPTDLALPLAFAVGAGYLLWIGRNLFALRAERERFRMEIRLLGAVFAIAVGVAVLGLLRSALPEGLFFALYAIAIGLAFFLVQVTLGLRPQLSAEVGETAMAVQAAYANTTLASVDCAAAIARLDALMVQDRLYADAELSLPGLAERLGLSAHQLSELLNARIGKGFARFLREHRIAAAKAMLVDEPAASVLSVGLAVGFTAQSNFYEAFREIEGTTPGQYRRLNAVPRAGR